MFKPFSYEIGEIVCVVHFAGIAKREEIDGEVEQEELAISDRDADEYESAIPDDDQELAVMERDSAEKDLQGMLRAERDPYDEMD